MQNLKVAEQPPQQLGNLSLLIEAIDALMKVGQVQPAYPSVPTHLGPRAAQKQPDFIPERAALILNLRQLESREKFGALKT